MEKSYFYKSDLHRYYGNGKPSFLQRLFKPYELRYINLYRYSQRHPKSLIGRMRLRSISKKTHIQIPPQVSIDKGLFILHFGKIIINHHIKAGKNFTTNPGVIKPKEHATKGYIKNRAEYTYGLI